MFEDLKVSIKRSSSKAMMPTRRSEESPGYDLFASEDDFLVPFESKYVATDWVICVPQGTFGRVISKRPNNPLFSVGSEILESGIEIHLQVHLTNKTNRKQVITRGTKIAFLMIDRVVPINMIERPQNECLDTRPTFQLFTGQDEFNLSIQTGYSIYDDSKLINDQSM